MVSWITFWWNFYGLSFFQERRCKCLNNFRTFPVFNICLCLGTDAILIRSTPSFVSEWRPMTANSEHSRLTLRHGLHEDPVYVKVEARTETGFIFPAFGSAQQDDDTGALYGGVVFVYNFTHIDIFVSHNNNNNNNRGLKRNWAAIYTGKQFSINLCHFLSQS